MDVDLSVVCKPYTNNISLIQSSNSYLASLMLPRILITVRNYPFVECLVDEEVD